MTAPDSPAVVDARRESEAQRAWGDPRVADTLDAVLAELAEARRQPRVWLEGDQVPAGVPLLAAPCFAFPAADEPCLTPRPVVELPDYAAAVAAERERREALDRPVPSAERRTSTATDSAREPVSDGSEARESPPADGGHTVTEQWDAHGGDVVWRTCTCGEQWTNDVETCPEGPVTTARRLVTTTERQAYALAHPSSDPRGLTAGRGLWRDDVTRDGNVLRTALAVDR